MFDDETHGSMRLTGVLNTYVRVCGLVYVCRTFQVPNALFRMLKSGIFATNGNTVVEVSKLSHTLKCICVFTFSGEKRSFYSGRKERMEKAVTWGYS